ncbi:carboxylate--amine ligase [Natronolimnohabitans innermongolicus]|uniref:ATP-grasp protein-like protein n=1 Tax=Natronolimnohabitans innermongolicus JCM 12255 TaxID=1227499 RepID=L9XBE3_9EURY|nr:ATP-grasp domain-containing protein [Natronolimnohabitans innermongolicus]ELY58962.1 ATP-grasp protein-like protein [Natronolimnohabitans innermongolicus JCM 12255]
MHKRGQGSVVIPAVAPSSVACVRSLGRRGVGTIAVSESETAPAFASRYCDESHVVPDPTEDVLGYRDALLELATRSDVETIAPIRDEDVWTLSRYRSAFADRVAPLWPSLETLRTVYDRVRLVETAAAADVAVPETRPLDAVDDWGRKAIVKPRYAVVTDEFVDTVSSSTIVHPGSVRYLEPGQEPDRESIREEMGHTPIVQEYVPGEEYALWALYDRGEPVATCQKHQLRGYSYAGNTSIARRTTSIPALERAGRAVLDALDWHGPASVQFVRDAATGEFTLLEVNPRFWVSVSCPIEAGVDFPYYFWQLARGEPVRTSETYETGVATHLLRGEMLYVLSVLREENPIVEPPSLPAAALEIAASTVRQPNFDHLSRDDPRPFVRDARNVASELFSAVVELPASWTAPASRRDQTDDERADARVRR